MILQYSSKSITEHIVEGRVDIYFLCLLFSVKNLQRGSINVLTSTCYYAPTATIPTSHYQLFIQPATYVHFSNPVHGKDKVQREVKKKRLVMAVINVVWPPNTIGSYLCRSFLSNLFHATQGLRFSAA